MNGRSRANAGFTLLEFTIASVLMLISMTAAITGWLYIMHAERLNSVQSELDMDVRSAIDFLRRDLRLTSLDKVFYHSSIEAGGPYSAISFPVAIDDDGDGLVELDPTNHTIIWDVTIIYHCETNTTPYELRITTFTNRDNTVSDGVRQGQLEQVVTDGDGEYAEVGSEKWAGTMTIFRNLFTWQISPKGAVFDAYAPTLGRFPIAPFGAAIQDDGTHMFKFEVVGKNPASSGFKVGLDSFVVSPCGVDREAEAQLPAASAVGGTPVAQYMGGGSWSGNYQLYFPALAEGSYFALAMDNDRWEETNFKGEGSVRKDTVVGFDTALTPMDFVVGLDGGWSDTNWAAWSQTGELVVYGDEESCVHSTEGDFLKRRVVRVILRGGAMQSGGYLDHSGGNCEIRLDSGAGALRITSAWIAECASNETAHPNTRPPAQLFFDGSASKRIESWGDIWAKPAAGTRFPIEKDKSYAVSFSVSGIGGEGTGEFWTEFDTNVPGCFMIPGPLVPSEADGIAWAAAADWTTLPYVDTNRLYVVKFMRTSYSTNGTFTSQIIDTSLADPEYTYLDWDADVPAGCDLRMKLRQGDNRDLSDAPDWGTIAGVGAPGPLFLTGGRYVQFQALLTSLNSVDIFADKTPRLKDVTIRWDGETKLADIGGSVTMGPDYGIFKVTMDGRDLVRAVTVDLEIFEDVSGFGGETKRLTSSMMAEVEPRNTGR